MPAVWLFDSNAISASETFLTFVRHLDRDARFIGPTPSSGANGVRLTIKTPSNLEVGFTSMKATLADGTPFYAEGIQPDERTKATPTTARAGRDLSYEAALAWLRGDKSLEPFLGPWKADDGQSILIKMDGP